MGFRTVIAACVGLSCATASTAAVASHAHVSGVVLALNPQPEPPGRARVSGIVLISSNPEASDKKAAGSVHAGPDLSRGALNPQPEPPGKIFVTESIRVALNPQPEPPGITDARRLPPGPCSELVVKVEAPGAAPVTARATDLSAGKCRFDVMLPGARPGSVAKVTFSRTR